MGEFFACSTVLKPSSSNCNDLQSWPSGTFWVTSTASHMQPSVCKRTELTATEWEDLKPLIRHWYIEQNKRRSTVELLIYQRQNFRPTKHQLTRKLDKWGFKKKGEMDAQRSLRRLHLLATLKQHFEQDLERPHRLERAVVAYNKEHSTCLTSLELADLWCPSRPPSMHKQPPINNQQQQQLFFATQMGSPFKEHASDVFFPSGKMIMEIDPFPVSTSSSHNSEPPATTTWESSQIKVAQLRKVRRMLPGSPQVLHIMKDLADIYMDLERPVLAAKYYRKVSACLEVQKNHNPCPFLSIQLDLVDAIRKQGKDKESAEQHGPIHDAIFKVSNPAAPDDLKARSLGIASANQYNLSNFKEAEEPRIQQLQLTLSNYGPRHPKTFKVITSLGTCVSEIGDVTTGEQLLQRILQIYGAMMQNFDAGVASTVHRLISLMRRHERYRESVAIGEMTVNKSTFVLGEEHPITMECAIELGISYRCQQMFQESREILTRTINKAIQCLDADHGHTLWAMSELGSTLLKEGKYREATPWFEKAFRGTLRIRGAGNRETVWNCTDLGECYIRQGQHEDALALYKQFLDDLRNAERDHREAMDDIRGKINKIEAQREGEVAIAEGDFDEDSDTLSGRSV